MDDYKPRGESASTEIDLFKTRKDAYAYACSRYKSELEDRDGGIKSGERMFLPKEAENSDDEEEEGDHTKCSADQYYYSQKLTEKNFFQLKKLYDKHFPGCYVPQPDFQVFVYTKPIHDEFET